MEYDDAFEQGMNDASFRFGDVPACRPASGGDLLDFIADWSPDSAGTVDVKLWSDAWSLARALAEAWGWEIPAWSEKP